MPTNVQPGAGLSPAEQPPAEQVGELPSNPMSGGVVVELDIPSRFDLVTVARMVVAAVASCVEALEGDRLDDLRWVTSEATTNAMQANLRTSTEGRVIIQVQTEDKTVHLTVIDEGPGMPPATVLPDVTHPDRLEREGGFGVPLMQMLSSGEVTFHSTTEGTTVEMELHQ